MYRLVSLLSLLLTAVTASKSSSHFYMNTSTEPSNLIRPDEEVEPRYNEVIFQFGLNRVIPSTIGRELRNDDIVLQQKPEDKPVIRKGTELLKLGLSVCGFALAMGLQANQAELCPDSLTAFLFLVAISILAFSEALFCFFSLSEPCSSCVVSRHRIGCIPILLLDILSAFNEESALRFVRGQYGNYLR